MQIRKSHALVVAALLSLAASEPACFYPDGKNATGLSPCNPNADVSHCCRNSDVCLTNGLCFSSGLGSVVRRACTDRTWKSPDCPSVCTIETFRSGDAVLTPCGPYNSFCCGQDNAARSCCDTGNATLTAQVAGGEPICTVTLTGNPTNSATSTGTTSATSTGTTSATLTGTASLTAASASCPKSLKTGRDALIGLAAAFGCAMLAAAALATYWRRGMKRQEQEKLEKELEKQRLGQEKQRLEQEKQRLEKEMQGLKQEMQRLQRLQQAMPASLRREMENAWNAGRTT